MKKLLAIAAIMVMANIAHAHSTALAVVQNASGNVGQNIKVYAQFTYTIENPTNSYQNYVGEETIEVNGHRYKNPISFSLPPHGMTKKSDPGVLNFKASQAGDFKSTARIVIAGNVGAAHYSHGKVKVNP